MPEYLAWWRARVERGGAYFPAGPEASLHGAALHWAGVWLACIPSA